MTRPLDPDNGLRAALDEDRWRQDAARSMAAVTPPSPPSTPSQNGWHRRLPMATEPRTPNPEAGDYIEDDPAAWEAFLDGARRYFAEHLPHLRDEFGDDGIGIAAGAMLSYLADEHGVYLRREPTSEAEVVRSFAERVRREVEALEPLLNGGLIDGFDPFANPLVSKADVLALLGDDR